MRIILAGIYGSSGIDTYTRLIGDSIADAGHAVMLVNRSGREISPRNAGVETFDLPPRRRSVRSRIGPLEGFLHHRSIMRLAREWNADVVHATQLELAVRARALIVTAWDPEVTIRGRLRLARDRELSPRSEVLYGVVDSIGIRRANAVIAITNDVASAVKHPHVVSIPPFLPDEEITSPRADRTTDCVVVANALNDPRKALSLAVQTVARVKDVVPDVRLVLIGGGAPEDLPDFCVVRGRLSRVEVAKALHRAGCCLITSAWEEFGYGGLEALAAGTPLVCPPLPAFSDAGSAEGVFMGERRAESLAAAVIDAFRAPSFTFPNSFRASVVVPRLLELYAFVSQRGR